MDKSEKFFSLLRWAVERKDFEDFWPVGLESTGPAYWPQLVLDLETIQKSSAPMIIPDYPTANVALVFCLIYGLRELDRSPSQCKALVEGVFESAQKSKYGDIFNAGGSNLLWESDVVAQKFESGIQLLQQGISAQDINVLSGSILALAESEYFMNHRIATEKHGPYFAADGNLYIVRSFKNLCPDDLWPELSLSGLRNEEFHLIFKYSPHEVQFDILSNLITPLPPQESLIGVALAEEDKNANTWNLTQFEKLTREIHHGICLIGNALANMNQQQKSERMTEILYFGCRKSMPLWKEKAQNAIQIGRLRSIRHPVPKFGDERLKYYDLMQSF